MDTGLYNIPVEEIRFRGRLDQFGPDVAPLRSNKGRPIIAIERETHYDLLDGWGRVSGLRNADAELAHAILVSEDDMVARGGPDDHEWNAAMFERYAPQYTYRTTN